MIRSTDRQPWAAALLLTFVSTSLFAATGSSAPPAPPSTIVTPEQIAVDSYNAGLELREKAVDLDERAAAEADADKRDKILAKQASIFEKAVERYEAAIEAKPDFVQAHGSLGYALRRLGRFEEAMRSYDTALEMNPNYPAAIEYRAEALLGLGRFDEVKEAYQKLSMMSTDHAAELMDAVKTWSTDPANAEAAAEAGFAEWARSHEHVSGTTSSGHGGGGKNWR